MLPSNHIPPPLLQNPHRIQKHSNVHPASQPSPSKHRPRTKRFQGDSRPSKERNTQRRAIEVTRSSTTPWRNRGRKFHLIIIHECILDRYSLPISRCAYMARLPYLSRSMGVERCRLDPRANGRARSTAAWKSGSIQDQKNKEMRGIDCGSRQSTRVLNRESMRDRSVEYHKSACGIQRSKSKISIGHDAPTRVEDGDRDNFGRYKGLEKT